ncbi:hypothetical protein SUGI_1134760 [Cryptomeria japonica]|nr:hypothetical protein SUGI_1134760 [Cryptomeria japonica]
MQGTLTMKVERKDGYEWRRNMDNLLSFEEVLKRLNNEVRTNSARSYQPSSVPSKVESARMSKRRGCAFGEGKFLPEESFQSWGSYTSALKDTKNRFRDRVLARSPVEVEINEIRARSGHEMKKTLNWWDLIWFGVGAIVGAGIFVLTGLEAKEDAGPAVLLSYVVSGISALLSVLCYTEFAVEIPSAGGSFAYLRVELGDFVAFIGAGNLILEYVVSGAAVARAWTSYLASLVNHHADDFRIKTQLSEGYNQLDPIAVAILFITAVIAIKSTKANTSKSIKLFRFYALWSFDAVSTLAEETKNPAVDIPVGLVGSMLVIITAYCLMAMTLCLMQNYKTIDTQAPFSIAFQQAGLGWAKYIVALGALKGMTTVLMARVPKVWGVPLVPWIPALSVAVNIFLLGSIDNASFIRFSVWTAIILLYYFFFGLHASYDTAKVAEAERIEKGDNMVPS